MRARFRCALFIAALALSVWSCSHVAQDANNTSAVAQPDTIKTSTQALPRTLAWLQALPLSGGVHLYDEQTKTYYHTDLASFEKKNAPASTFKIFTSLIALETGLLRDQYEIKPWLKRQQKNPDWNKDQHLKEAFAESTNWFFNDLVDSIGPQKMNEWLDKIGYPARVKEGIAAFWLDASFQITPQEQIQMMQKLYHRQMPFRATTYDMTQDIMLRKDTLGHKLFGKTGWGAPGNNNVGWYVGWLHRDNKAPVYFATCIEQPEPAHPRFEHWRKEITEWALFEINALTYSPDSISH